MNIIKHNRPNQTQTNGSNKGQFVLNEEIPQYQIQLTENSNIQKDLSLIEVKQNVNKVTEHKSNYRADIDGLRTIAVSIVIIFHAWPQFMAGGFIGVDVFFVISGYLISGIIIKQTAKQSFSFVDFYTRRIKRIYPALLLVLSAVLFLTYWKLIKQQLKITAKTIMASTVFSANLEIMIHQKGYFDPDTKSNYLLHLWSLGVQEQFYILWPCLICIVMKVNKNKGLFILTGYTLISFILGIIAIYYNPKFAFYFPLCRFWQMSVGGIIAFTNIKIQNKYIVNGLSFTGIISILILVWVIDENNLFPGWWATIPTFGAAFIIQAGKQAIFNTKVLSSRIFVFIGKISYPLYLWHWPLLVLSKTFYKGSNSILVNPLTMVLLTIALSLATYYGVEKKIRYKKGKRVIFTLLALMMTIGILALLIYNNPQSLSRQQAHLRQLKKLFEAQLMPGPNDFYIKNRKSLPNSSKNKDRKPPTLQKLQYSISQWYDENNIIFPFNGTPIAQYLAQTPKQMFTRVQTLNPGKQNKLLIIGDSHATALSNRFLFLHEQSIKNHKQNEFPTVVLLSEYTYPLLPCAKSYNPILAFVKRFKPQKILLRSLWQRYFDINEMDGPLHESPWCHIGYGDHNYNQSLLDTQRDLKVLSDTLKSFVDQGIQVYVASYVPQLDLSDPRNIVSAGINDENVKSFSLSKWREQNKFIINLHEKAINESGAKLIDFTQHLCWEDNCQIFIPNGYAAFIDNNHYTTFYSRYWVSAVDFLVQSK